MSHYDKDLKAYKINYVNGILPNTIVYAETPEEAMKMGLGEYRRNIGTWESVDFRPLKSVVISAELFDCSNKA